MLDIQSRKPHSYYTGHIGPQSAQYSWLTNDLSSESRKKSAFTIVCFFTPLFLDDDEETEYCEKLLCPLFEQYNVDLVVNGSRHYFSRIMHSGISYMVSGGGGAVLELPKKEGREKAGFSHAAFHHLRVSMHYPVMTVDGIDNSGTVFFSQAFTANAEKIFPAGASSDAGFSPSLALFGSPGCDECRRVKEEIFPGLKQKYHGLSLRLDFYDVDKEANFSAYGDLESRLGNTKHQFPVLKIGNRLLSGTSLTFEAIDALIREQSAGNGKNAPKPHNGSPMVLFAAVFIALSAILLIVLLSQRRKMG
jgi:glutaredoxin